MDEMPPLAVIPLGTDLGWAIASDDPTKPLTEDQALQILITYLAAAELTGSAK
jgi:hypothetical protein